MPGFFLNKKDRRLAGQAIRGYFAGQSTKRPFARRRRHPYPLTSVAVIGYGEATADVASTESTFEVDNVTFDQSGDSAVDDSSSTLEINNTRFWFEISEDGGVQFIKPVGSDVYYAIQAECPS